MPQVDRQPTRARMILAFLAVVITVVLVWKFIDHRSQPPPPPHPVGAMPGHP